MIDLDFLETVEITDETAEYLGGVCTVIATGCGLGAPVAGIIGVGASLAARLCNAGYDVPELDALRSKADEIAALPDLTV